MEHLPKKALSNVAAYLDKRTRALFAVALTAPSSSWEEWDSTKSPSRASKIVISGPYHDRYLEESYEEEWDELHLYDSDTDITDADVFGILVCIDAANKVKKLRLWNCVSVGGDGLSPLRGSTILEQIDLSRAEFGIMGRTQLISEYKVLPFLQSIIETDRNSLRYLRLPKAWKEGKSKELGLFFESYNRALNRHKLGCSECSGVCLGTNQRPWMPMQDEDYGVQNFTCNRCKKHFCADCDRKCGLQLCPYCEDKHCAECATVKRCVDCHITKCTDRQDFCTCDICDKTQFIQCDSGIYCELCERGFCGDCPHVKCKSCRESTCMECLDNDAEFVKQRSLWDESCNSNGGKMEYCFRIGGGMCLNCHIVKCYWKALPTRLQQLLHDFSKEISIDSLVRFWKECTAFVGMDKECDLNAYEEGWQALLSSYAIAIDFLLKGRTIEAVYMMFYGGFIREIWHRGPDYVVNTFAKKRTQPSGPMLCTYLSCFSKMISISRTQAGIVGYLENKLPSFVEKYRDARRLIDILSKLKVHSSNSDLHCVKDISIEDYNKELSPIYGDSISVSIFYFNNDSQDREGSFNCPVYKDTSLGWLLKRYVIHCRYRYNPKITPSTKYFRIVHKGKTIFLSSSGKKTLHELGIRDGDTIAFGGVDLGDSDKSGDSANKVSTKKGASKSKKPKKPSGRKQKKKSKAPHIPLPTEDEIVEKHRETHSRAMDRVFEELDPLLKGIRNQLNNLALLKSAPKVRATTKGSQNEVLPVRTLMDEDSVSIGGKAGKTYYPVFVGEVTNLYKTHKSLSTRCAISIDLHGYTKDEALAELDKNLPVWINVAMRGEYPWVVPVDIICGGGSQILSEAVKDWIRSKPQVANRPKK